MASALLLLGAGYLRDEPPTVPLPSSSPPPPPPPPFACSDLAVRTVLTEGACKNVRYPENNCSNFFYHNGPHIDPDKDRWRLCVAPSGPENDVCEGILLTGCWPPPPPLPNSPPPPPLGCAAGAPACPPGFYEMPSPGGCRDNFCGTGLYDAFKGLDTESAEACLRRDWCKAYEWFPLPPALLPSGAPCELHRDYPVQAAEDCGETGASSLAHCCCVRLPGPSE